MVMGGSSAIVASLVAVVNLAVDATKANLAAITAKDIPAVAATAAIALVSTTLATTPAIS
jgi:hypothetical protein